MKTQSVLMVAFAVVLTATVAVSVPTAINYQGRLTDGSANPVPDGTYSVGFTIYDAAVGGNVKWAETQNVTTIGGIFAVLLGSVNPIIDTVFKLPSRYLGIKVEADPEISPRTMIVTVPWSFRTSTVDGTTGGTITGDVDISGKTTMAEFKMPTGATEYYVLVSDSIGNGTWQTIFDTHNTLDEAYDQNGGGAGRIIHADSGSVEIHGTSNNDALYVPDLATAGANANALIKASHHGTGTALLVEHTNSGKGIVVDHSGTNIGIDVALSNTANAKPGIQSKTLGTSYGVYGETGTDNLTAIAPVAGVTGYSGLLNPASERNGVAGESNNSNGVFGLSHRTGTYTASTLPFDIRAGVRGATPDQTSGVDNFAVAGIAAGYEGTGVLGIGHGERGHGVIGIPGLAGTPPPHTQVGVWGLTREQPWASFKTSFPLTDNSANKKSQVAVLGQAINFVAVWGESDGQTGVVGTSGAKKGLVALPDNKHIGVYGRSSQGDGQGVYGEADSSLGVYGISRSASFDDAGVVGEGQGSHDNAAALEIRNGAIRVSGAAKPAGKETLMVFGWMPVVTGSFPCPTCTHEHVEAYETEFTITNPLVNATRSIIQLTVEDPVFSMMASIKAITDGAFDIKVVLPYGAVPQVDLPSFVTVHYLIINE